MKPLFLLVLLVFSTPLAAQAYRWVDANGVTHYSDSPPAETEQTTSVETREYRAAQRRQSLADTASEGEPYQPADRPPGQAEADIETGTTPEVGAVDCALAVANTTTGLNERIQLERHNLEAGHISRANYEAARDQALETQRTVSERHCQYANGSTQAFYRCMAGDQPDLDHCQQQHSPLL